MSNSKNTPMPCVDPESTISPLYSPSVAIYSLIGVTLGNVYNELEIIRNVKVKYFDNDVTFTKNLDQVAKLLTLNIAFLYVQRVKVVVEKIDQLEKNDSSVLDMVIAEAIGGFKQIKAEVIQFAKTYRGSLETDFSLAAFNHEKGYRDKVIRGELAFVKIVRFMEDCNL